MGLSWEKDETIRHFKFSKFAKEFFTNGVDASFSKEPLTSALLPKKQEVDGLVSMGEGYLWQRR